MKKNLPKPLKYLLAAAYIFLRAVVKGSPAKDPRLNLAGVLPPKGSKKIVHGGKVKLLHLRERFGDNWTKFNIAYFVSSGLPFALKLWMRIYKLFGVKAVWNQNGVAYPALYPRGVVERINNLMKPIHNANYVVYQTEFVKRCADKYLGKFTGPSSILINPVDTEHFKPRTESLPEEPLIVIMSGNHFESEERMRVSLEAIKELRKSVDTRLIIIGKLDHEIEEKEWIEKVGAFTQDKAPELYRRAHIFLHLKYLDPCPTLVLEALATGLPVVGSASGGLPEMVEKGAGGLIPITEDFEKLYYPSPKEVAEAFIKIYKDLDSYSRAARQSALKFDSLEWLNKHEQIFKELLAK